MLSSFKSKIGNLYCPVYILELLTSVINEHELPASNDDPNAVKVGNFAIIPTIDKSDYKSVYESEKNHLHPLVGYFY